MNMSDLGSERNAETQSETLSDGRRRITEQATTLSLYVRVHYEPTMFNQEWRTPPLWGVADSAPYMHDGRADTLLEAITMHDGEAAGTRDRFLHLPLADRLALIAFLKTLVAPSTAPQTQS
jgi:cytochrome c peroxidase